MLNIPIPFSPQCETLRGFEFRPIVVPDRRQLLGFTRIPLTSTFP
jgi:hypothetical protein